VPKWAKKPHFRRVPIENLRLRRRSRDFGE
jgi:hypothetical protein